jgi:hypothetical protein
MKLIPSSSMLTGELMKEKIKNDSQGRPIELSWVDDEGNITVNLYGVACMRSTYLDGTGISREERCYDQSGNPIEDKLGVAMIRRLWDPIRKVETETYHDINGKLVEILYGFCEVHYHMDSSDQLHSVYCYDKERMLVKEPGKDFTVFYVC